MSYQASMLMGGVNFDTTDYRQNIYYDDTGKVDSGDIDFDDYEFKIVSGGTAQAYWLGNLGNWDPQSSSTCAAGNANSKYVTNKVGTWCPTTVTRTFDLPSMDPDSGDTVTQTMVMWPELKLRMINDGTINITVGRDAGINSRILLFEEESIQDGGTPNCVFTNFTWNGNSAALPTTTLAGGKYYVAHFQYSTVNYDSESSTEPGRDSWGMTGKDSHTPTSAGYCIDPWPDGQGTPISPTYANLPDVG